MEILGSKTLKVKYKNNQKHIDRCGFCYFYYLCYKDEIDSQILNYTAKYLPAPFL